MKRRQEVPVTADAVAAERRGERAGSQMWSSAQDYKAGLADEVVRADRALLLLTLSWLATSGGRRRGRWWRPAGLGVLLLVDALLASPVLEILGLSGIETRILAVAILGVLGWAAHWVGAAFRAGLRGIRRALALAILAGLPVVIWCLAILRTTVVIDLFGVQLPEHAIVAMTILFAGFNVLFICVAAAMGAESASAESEPDIDDADDTMGVRGRSVELRAEEKAWQSCVNAWARGFLRTCEPTLKPMLDQVPIPTVTAPPLFDPASVSRLRPTG